MAASPPVGSVVVLAAALRRCMHAPCVSRLGDAGSAGAARILYENKCIACSMWSASRAECGVHHVQLQLDEELEKLRNLEPSSSEFNVTRNYLDWSALSPVRTRLDRIGSPSCFRLMRPWRAVRSGGRAHPV